MAFSVSPSVIVREVDASAAVPAIATPPAAIAGVFNWGPVNEAVLVSSEDVLAQRFGRPTANNFETFFVAADYLSYANALYVSRADNGATTAANTTFEAAYTGSLGDSVSVSWTTASGFSSELYGVGDIPANKVSDNAIGQPTTFNASVFTFEVANTDQLAAGSIGAGDILTIGNDSAGYQDFGVISVVETPVIDNLVTIGYQYTITTDTKYLLAEFDVNKLSFSQKFKYYTSFQSAPSANHIHAVVSDADGGITGQAGTILEIYQNASTQAGAQLQDGTSNYFNDLVGNSEWVAVANTSAWTTSLSGKTKYERLDGATDGSSETTVGLAGIGQAWDVFKNSNEIDVSFLLQGKGDDAGTTANYIVGNIAEYRKDCVAFLSPSKEAAASDTNPNTQLTKILAHRNKIQNSSYWFMDSGYKYRYDKYNDVYRWVPMNGDMAGLASRVEVFESPAGFRKGVVKNIVKLAFNPNKAQRDVLYSSDINPVMSQVGQGIVLFGDKTGYGVTSAFDRLNVRRLFIAVEKAIASAAQSFLFELNDEFTQTQFKNIVEPFLREIQGRRGITDFRVISDSTVNTPEVIDANKFKASIFIKPARSINVIELTFVATRTGVEFDEIVGSLT